MPPKVDVAKLKDQVNELLQKEKLKEALVAYTQLEAGEPTEPRWPHRKGDLLLRMKNPKDAVGAYERAVDVYVSQGFAARGAALAKVILGLDPARKDVLARIDGQPMRDIRNAQAGTTASGAVAAAAASQSTHGAQSTASTPSTPSTSSTSSASSVASASDTSPAPSSSPPKASSVLMDLRAQLEQPPGTSHRASAPPSLVEEVLAGADQRARKSMVFDAPMLEPHQHAEDDEIRFVDTEEPASIELGLDEIEDLETLLDDGAFVLDDAPAIVDLVAMPSVPLFADIRQEALTRMLELADLVELDDGEPLVRKGDAADSLFILAEGRGEVRLDDGQVVPLAEGEIVGETCLFAGMKRGADVFARGKLRALRLGRGSLEQLVHRWPELGGILYDLLTRRLVQNLLRHSEIFTAFDPSTRVEVGKLFEVRRAPPETTLIAAGKRADGMYVPLLGKLEATFPDGSFVEVPNGTLLGEQSLLSRAPAQSTIVTRTEAVLLRLSTTRFNELASMYPSVLAHLADLAARGSFEDQAMQRA